MPERGGAVPELRRTDDMESVRSLALAAGLEEGTFENVVTAFGYFLGEELVGCVALKKEGDRFAVEWLAVAEELRGKGLGTMLVQKIEAEAKMRGAEQLCALARVPRFFEKIGFRIGTSGENRQPIMSNCLLCKQYQRTCFPAVVVKDL